jgi:hypothetical protein
MPFISWPAKAASQPYCFPDLPADTQDKIVSLVGRRYALICTGSLTLVCKHWHRLVWQDPAFWQHVVASAAHAKIDGSGSSAQWWQRKLALVRRVSHLVASFEYAPVVPAEWFRPNSQQFSTNLPISEFLAALDPLVLRQLVIREPQALTQADDQALSRFSKLQALQLELRAANLPPSVPELLEQACGMHELVLEARPALLGTRHWSIHARVGKPHTPSAGQPASLAADAALDSAERAAPADLVRSDQHRAGF